jgi:hypothetical protein
MHIFESETVDKKQTVSFDDIVNPINSNSNIINDDDFYGESSSNNNNTSNNDYDINDLLDML